jgi:hypothetical protein
MLNTLNDLMKADISIPNPIYETSEKLAQQLGMSLSDFFLAALTEYVAKYQKLDITERLNQVYESESSSLDPGLTNIQMISIGNEKWE